MSLLSICQGVADEIPTARPAIVVGSTDRTARLLLACAQAAGKSLARRIADGWLAQCIEHTFTNFALSTTGTVASGNLAITGLASTTGLAAGDYAFGTGIPANAQIATVDSSSQVTLVSGFAPTSSATGEAITFGRADYSLPSDFLRVVDGTLWDRSRFWEMRGPMSPSEWQLYKSSPIGRASIQRRWRIRLPSGSAAGATPKFSIDPVPTDNGSALVFEYVSNAWCKSSGGVAQTAWAADDDTGILDEYLIQLDTKWRFLERLGLDWTASYQEAAQEIDKAVGADGGAPVIDMAREGGGFLLTSYQVPEGNFG